MVRAAGGQHRSISARERMTRSGPALGLCLRNPGGESMSKLVEITDAVENEIEAVRLIQLAVKGTVIDAETKDVLLSALETHVMKLEEIDAMAADAVDEARGGSAEALAA